MCLFSSGVSTPYFGRDVGSAPTRGCETSGREEGGWGSLSDPLGSGAQETTGIRGRHKVLRMMVSGLCADSKYARYVPYCFD